MHRIVVLVLVLVEEAGLDLQDRVQVEAADVEDVRQRRFAEVHRLDRRARIDPDQPRLELFALLGADQVGLGQQDAVGEAHLLLRLAEIVELLVRVLGVHQRHDGIEQVVVADVLVHEEGLRHRPGVGHAGGLDDDALEIELLRLALGLQFAQDAHQVAAHGAADAAVVHLDDLFARILHQQLVVDAGLAEFVFDDGDALAVLLLEDAVEQRRLAAAEEAGEYGHRHHVLCAHE